MALRPSPAFTGSAAPFYVLFPEHLLPFDSDSYIMVNTSSHILHQGNQIYLTQDYRH